MKKSKFWKKRVALVSLTGLIASGLIGCVGGKKADCTVKENHAHLYVDDDGFNRYINSEYLTYDGYKRTEDYKILSWKDIRLNEFETETDLLNIEQNQESIITTMEEQKDYYKYRYSYIYNQPIPHVISIGETTSICYTYIPLIQYGWTKDANHVNLTGEVRLCHYVYQALDIKKDENGNYVLIASDYVDDLMEIADKYPYIKKKFYKVVNQLGNEIDYENMNSDVEENILEEDKSLEKEDVSKLNLIRE